MQFKTTTQERYWEMLECLPPAAQTGAGFLVGEPYDHDAKGRERYFAFFWQRYDDFEKAAHGLEEAFYEAAAPMTVAEFKAATLPMIRANLIPNQE